MIIKEIENSIQIFHPFDKAFKVIIDYCPNLAFEYLNLPGNFLHLCKNNFIGSDLTEYFLDSVFLSKSDSLDLEDFIINLEHQSSHVSLEKLKIINMYCIHASYYFVRPVVSMVLTDVESYGKSIKEYGIDDYLVHRPSYIYFTVDEINKKLNNLTFKHDLKETLSDMEAMDIVFLPIISPRFMRKEVTKALVNMFNDLKIPNKRIVYVALQVLKLMIIYFFEGDELIELSGMLDMEFEEAIDKLFDSRFNELNDELYQTNQKLKLANKERDSALSEASLAQEEKNRALSEAKLLEEEKRNFIEMLKSFIKEGKLTAEDLSLFGVFL